MKVFIDNVLDENGDIKGRLCLESDSMQFIIREYNGKLDASGKEISKTHGYFPNVSFALHKVIKMKIMKSTATTLQELREDIRKIEERICREFDWNAAKLSAEGEE
ncbi:hypothetical protein ACX93W_26830 [Paenibacillus sp. CAU 1782]